MRARASAHRDLAHAYADGLKGIWLAVFILAILLDFGTHGSSASKTCGVSPGPAAYGEDSLP